MQTIIVRPARETPGSTRCSFSDSMMRAEVARLAFFYRERIDPRRLAGALAVVLADYYVFAAHLRTDGEQLVIEHGAGHAIVEVVESRVPLQTLINAGQADDAALLSPRMNARRVARGRGPVLKVRLTLARDGSALGMTWHHSIADMHSTALLLSAWTAAYRGEPHQKPYNTADREAFLSQHLPDPEGAGSLLRLYSPLQIARLLRFAATPREKVHLDFSREELNTIHAALAGDEKLTVNDTFCAHMFSRLRQLPMPEPLSRLVLLVNYRKRVGLPPNLVGNLLGWVAVTAAPQDDAHTIGKRLRTCLDEYATRHVDHFATARFRAAHRGRLERLRALPSIVYPPGSTLVLSSLTAFSVYDVAFESAPLLFSPLSSGLVPWLGIVLDRPDRAGADVVLQVPRALATQVVEVMRSAPSAVSGAAPRMAAART
jgi:hypothetical protein